MNRRGRGWLASLLVIVTITGGMLSACGGPKARLKIVASFPMRGVAAGVSIVNAVELAFEEAQWQVGGYPIELVKRDNANEKGQWDASLEKANIEEAVADSSVMAYIGPLNSGAAKVSIPIASRAGLLQISPSASWPGLTKVGFAPGEPAKFYPTGQRTFYRTCPTDDVQAAAAVRWAKSLGFKKVYIIDDGEGYGQGLAYLFEQRAQAAGLKIVGHETIDKDATGFMVTMSNLWHWSPDVAFFSGYTPNGVIPLLKQMRTVKPTIKAAFMGTETIVDTAFIEGVGAEAEGMYATVLGVPPENLTEVGQEFFQAYQAKYGRAPEPFAAYGYDAARVVLRTLALADPKDRVGLLKAIKTVQTFQGSNGSFGFDKNGDTTLVGASGVRVEGGQFKFVQPLDVK